MVTGQRKSMPSQAKENWRCLLCDRSDSEIGDHPLPVRQRAHLLPNRLTGGQQRYGGAKNIFTDAEWGVLLAAIGSELCPGVLDSNKTRKQAIAHCYDLCGECHEEVLSEPVYLPCVVDSLRKHFKGRTRVEKILLLARILKLGTEALESENNAE